MKGSSLIGFCAALAASQGCGEAKHKTADTLSIYNAASLSAPMRSLLDTFSRRTGTVIQEEHGASLELARRITELNRVPDVIALADREVFPELLVPKAASWYATFARNRMVVAYTEKSRFANEINSGNWRTTVLKPGVLLGRTDPVLAPAGYRALIMYGLAEKFYNESGLAARLTAATPASLIRGNAADLAALLKAGELDYIVDYESLALAQNFKYVQLPVEMDLSDASMTSTYASVSVPVGSIKDTIVRIGSPILYGVSVPLAARHPMAGSQFVAFMLGEEGRKLLHAQKVDALEHADITGTSVPDAVSAATKP